MKRFLCLFLALAMLAGFLPALAIGIGAADTGVTVTSSDGKYSVSLEKTTFKKGEPIMVAANGQSYYDWVGVVASGASNYDKERWHYLGQCGYGVGIDVTRGKALEAGEYQVYFVPNDGGYSWANIKVDITVTDEVYDGTVEYPAVDYGDLTQLVTQDNKRTFKKGEPIMVAATGGSNHWIGIYDNVCSFTYNAWKSVSQMGGSGNYYDLTAAYNFAPGTYLIRLCSSWNTPYEANTVAGIYITIVEDDYEKPDEEEKLDPETGLPADFGINPSRLTLEKKIFKKGEPIKFTAVSTSNKDWVGIYEDGVNTKSMQYVYVTLKESGAVKEIGNGLNLPAGNYLLRLVPNDETLAGGESNTISGVWIKIVDEEYIDPDQGGEGGDIGGGDVGGDDSGEVVVPETNPVTVQNGTHSLTVNKTAFAVGESIKVTAVGVNSLDWVGIAPRGYREATIRWDYITTMGNGVPYDLRNATQLAGSADLLALKDLPAGLYTIYFIERDQYLKDDYTFSINISVGGVEDNENGVVTDTTGGVSTVVPANPVDAIYNITGENGFAAGTVTVTVPKEAIGSYNVIMFWANENGALNGYTAHTRVKAKAESVTLTLDKSVFIPSGATRLLVYLENVVNGTLSEECISIDLPQNSDISVSGNPNASFFVVSDIHIGRDETSSVNFKKMIKEAILLNPDGIPIYVVGDMADHGKEAEYVLMMSLYNEVLAEEGKNSAEYPLYLAIGNHDYPSANTHFLQYATLPNGEHPTDTSYDFWLNGYHYIFLGGDNASGLGARFSAETLAWLDEKLSENRDPSRPTFIFLHQSIYNTVAGSLPGEGWHGVENEDEFVAVISKYPEIMMFNGHSHWEMDSLSNAFNGTDELPIHAFNCASVSYLWNTAGQHLDGSQGYYVEVYGDKVLVRGRDFVNGLWVSAAQYAVELEALEGGDGTTGGECEHEFTTTDICYSNGYMQNGTKTVVCSACGVTMYETVEPMITFAGYSVATYNTSSICAGYTVNCEVMNECESVNNTVITLGMVAASYDNVPNAKPINADGTAVELESGRVISYALEVKAQYVDIILQAKDWTAYGDKKTILCMYLIENGVVGYVCDTDAIMEVADYVTYNSLIN